MSETPTGGNPEVRPQFRRRIIVIKRALQMKYVMLVFFSVLITMTVISLDVYYVVGKTVVSQIGEENFLPLVKRVTELLAIHLSIYCLIVIVVSVFVSHKFAGPIFRLERIAESIAGGDLGVRANFREGDEFFETAEYINRMIAALREKVGKDQEISKQIVAQLEQLSEGLKSGKIPEKQAAATVQELAVKIKTIGASFKM